MKTIYTSFGVAIYLCCWIGIATSSFGDTDIKQLSAEEVSKRLGLEVRTLISTWNAGFPETMTWRADHVVADESGGVALRLSSAPPGAERPFRGGEFQTRDYAAVWGRVEWQARLPRSPSGSVAAMFLYRKPFDAKALRELDFEYVAGDPTGGHPLGTMQMAIHMKRHDGVGAKEVSAYRIAMPERCIREACGWSIEFQPKRMIFQLRLDEGAPWQTIGEFMHGRGWDMGAGEAWGGIPLGSARNFSNGEIWSEQPMNAFASYWATDDSAGWLGRLDKNALRKGAPDFVLTSMKVAAYTSLSSFSETDWSVRAGRTIDIHAHPDDELSATAIEYRVDGGEWRALGPVEVGTYPIDPAAPGQMVEIRLVARGPAFAVSRYEVVSEPSDARAVPAF